MSNNDDKKTIRDMKLTGQTPHAISREIQAEAQKKKALAGVRKPPVVAEDPSLLRSLQEQSAKVGGYITEGYEQGGVPGAVGGVGRAISEGAQELAGLSQSAGEAVTAGGEDVLSGVQAGFTGTEPPPPPPPATAPTQNGVRDEPAVPSGRFQTQYTQPTLPEGSASMGAEYTPSIAEAKTGIEETLSSLPAHMRNQPRYRRAAEMMTAGPAGIRTGSMIRTPAVDTGEGAEADRQARAEARGFTDMDRAATQTIRGYQRQATGQYPPAGMGPEELQQRGMASHQPGPHPWQAGARLEAERGAGTVAGGGAGAGGAPQSYTGEPKLSEQNAISRRFSRMRRDIGAPKSPLGGYTKSQRQQLTTIGLAEEQAQAQLRGGGGRGGGRGGAGLRAGAKAPAADAGMGPTSFKDRIAAEKLGVSREQLQFSKQKASRETEMSQIKEGRERITSLFPDRPDLAEQAISTFSPLLEGNASQRALGVKSFNLLEGMVGARKETANIPVLTAVFGIGDVGRPGVSGLQQVTKTFKDAAEALNRYKGTKTTKGDSEASFTFGGKPTKVKDMNPQTRAQLLDMVESGELEQLKQTWGQ